MPWIPARGGDGAARGDLEGPGARDVRLDVAPDLTPYLLRALRSSSISLRILSATDSGAAAYFAGSIV